ncbi:hypothetical protein Fcan01_22707 [Folsomia candida]|uniref:Uncharacterized protein n=1 Tax=Folsomia candida TaxID=158441 RepID=A0A226DAM5_FOLCA|nr:hypothetical protein Fcan01_22707 [Folsomia candida]
MAKAEKLRLERNGIAAKLCFIAQEVDYHNKTPFLDLPTLHKYMVNCDEITEKLDDNFLAVSELAPADIDDHLLEYHEQLTAVRKVQCGLRAIITSLMPVGGTATATPTGGAPPVQAMRLPKFEIQQFHGECLDWTTFKDTFEAAIHTNPSLSKVQKFTYLKSLLKGEAARFTADLTLTEANYDLAWIQLHERYQNRRKITTAILDRYFTQSRSNGSAKSIKSLIDGTNRCIRSLEQLGFSIENTMEIVYVHQMINKLDSNARDLWEHTVKDKDIPKYSDM